MEDLPGISRVLEGDGWRHAPSEDDDGGTGYELAGVRLELTYRVRDDDGSIFTPLRYGRALWSEEAFGDDVREPRGVRAHVVALAPLMSGKSSPRDDPEDAVKDRADTTILSQLNRE